MEIAIIADDAKKELMAQFCIAYRSILEKHHLFATQSTGNYIADVAGMEIDLLMPGESGGCEQILSRISFDEVDIMFYFRDTEPKMQFTEIDLDLLRICDVRNIPVATNIATAECLVMALQQGMLDWREFINPRSQYNIEKKAKAQK